MVKSPSFWQSDNSGLRQSLRNPYVFQCFAYVCVVTRIGLTIRLRQTATNMSIWHMSTYRQRSNKTKQRQTEAMAVQVLMRRRSARRSIRRTTAFTSAGRRGRVRMKEGAMWARGLMKHFSLTARLRFAYAELTAMFRINFGN